MKKIVVALLSILLLFCVACEDQKEVIRLKDGSVEFTTKNYPKVCVTRYTEHMGVNMTVAVLGCDAETAKGIITVCDTTDECYEKLIKGECDIVIAHDYGESAKAALKNSIVRFNATEFDHDALVFVTNGSNGVESLTPEQLKSIYNQEVKVWNELGGAELPITLFGCSDKTAVQNAFEKYVSNDAVIPPVVKTVITEKGEFSTEIDYDNRNGALGYTLLSISGDFSESSVKPLSINGVLPSEETVKSGQYSFVVPINAVIRAGDPSGLDTKVLYEWMLSEQGRAAIGKMY